MAQKFNALRFQHYRVERGFTLQEFADKLSAEINSNMPSGVKNVRVRPATICRWESGQCKPSKRYIYAIPKVLEIKSSDLITAGR